MAFCDSKFTGCSYVRSEVICDQLVGDKAIFLQQLAHQFKRRPLVPPSLDQHVEDLALGVDGAPQIDHPAIDFQIDFIQMSVPACASALEVLAANGVEVMLAARLALVGAKRSLIDR